MNINLRHCAVLALLLLASTLTARSSVAAAGAGPRVLTGSLGGAAYKIEVPAQWNGTLLLYSHFYLPPGSSNPAVDARDPVLGAWLLAHGYALAGSSYRHGTGWAVEQAFARAVAAAGRSNLLRQLYVQRAHHCSFTRAETLTALQTLVHRLDTGQWGNSTNPDALNVEAADLESDPALARLAPLAGFYTTTIRLAPAFVPFRPGPYLRPSGSRIVGR